MDDKSRASRFDMVDVGEKPVTSRTAIAEGRIRVGQEAFKLIKQQRIPKGDVLALAEAAGVLAAKKTSELIPLCHPLSLDRVQVSFLLEEETHTVKVDCEAKALAKTGVEMEALSGVMGALLCVYDLTKGINPALSISDVRLKKKLGGKRGLWEHPELKGELEESRSELQTSCGLKGKRVAVITVSDRVSRGESEDSSGPAIADFLRSSGAELVGVKVVSDEISEITAAIEHFAETEEVSLILTTGGTGLGPRDVTPEAVEEVCERLVPGIAELLRLRGLEHTPRAALSRGVAGMLGKTLVISLPGSPKGVLECLAALAPILPHALHIADGGGHD